MTARWKYNKANTRDGVAEVARQKSLNMPQKLKVDIVNVVQPQVDKLCRLVQEV